MMSSSTERYLFDNGFLVLHGPWVCTITTVMQNGDEGFQSIILAVLGLFVKMLIPLELQGIFSQTLHTRAFYIIETQICITVTRFRQDFFHT